MSLKPQPLPEIPEDTRQIAERLYSPSHPHRMLAEQYADVVSDKDFADLYPERGQPAFSPARLALITILQASENCSDRLAAEMVRSRIDWKYALHLSLEEKGLDPTVLCEFRQRVMAHEAQRRTFDAFLQRFAQKGLLAGYKTQRSDSIAVMAAVRELNRLELVMESLRLALEAIARHQRHWWEKNTPEEWDERYREWTQAERIVRETGKRGAARTHALLIRTGEDGFQLLDALSTPDAPGQLEQLRAVEVFKEIWQQQYERVVPETSRVESTTEDTTRAASMSRRTSARKRVGSSAHGLTPRGVASRRSLAGCSLAGCNG